MEGDGGGTGTTITHFGIRFEGTTLEEIFLANNVFLDVDHDHGDSGSDNKNFDSPTPNFTQTLGDILNVENKKFQRHGSFLRSRLTPSSRFFRISRSLSKPLEDEPQPGLTLGAVLNDDKKASSMHGTSLRRSIQKVTFSNIFSREKRSPPPPPPPPPLHDDPTTNPTPDTVFDKDKKQTLPPNTPFVRKLLSNIRNNEGNNKGTGGYSMLVKKPWNTSKIRLKFDTEDPPVTKDKEHDTGTSTSTNTDTDIDKDTNTDTETNTIMKNSLGSESFKSLYSFEDEFFDDPETLTEEIEDEYEDEVTVGGSCNFELVVNVATKEEKTQRKLSRGLFLVWCLYVGCLSFSIFTFFVYYPDAIF